MAGRVILHDKGIAYLGGLTGGRKVIDMPGSNSVKGAATIKLKLPVDYRGEPSSHDLIFERSGQSFGPGATITIPSGEAAQLVASGFADYVEGAGNAN